MLEHAPVIFEPEENKPEVNQHHFVITRISDGLAFGHGAISGHDDEPEILSRTDEAIHKSRHILVPVDRYDNGEALDDDGCGDGRGTVQTFSANRTFKRSLNRAKVFGGSTVMAAASLIGTGRSKHHSLDEVFSGAILTMQERGIDFGAHIDEHAEGKNCGCGAIDKAPEAFQAAIQYEQPIRDVIDSLGVDTSQLDGVYSNFHEYVDEIPDQPVFSGGRRVMEKIKESGKVIKKLGGIHRERRIILNMVRGYTVNQQLIREATNGRAQAFAVDIPRLEDIAHNLFPDNADKQTQAYLSELVYTLSIAAVLTKGDLPVDMIQDEPQPAVA